MNLHQNRVIWLKLLLTWFEQAELTLKQLSSLVAADGSNVAAMTSSWWGQEVLLCLVTLTPSFSSGDLHPSRVCEISAVPVSFSRNFRPFPAVMKLFCRYLSLAMSTWHPGLLI